MAINIKLLLNVNSYDISRYPGHVREVVYNERLSDWRGVITVSGDGMIHEVLNGLFDRPDWREALSRLPLGLIPGGSGNGLARSILNELDEPFDGTGLGSALLNVARGRVKNLDLFYVESTQMEPRYLKEDEPKTICKKSYTNRCTTLVLSRTSHFMLLDFQTQF